MWDWGTWGCSQASGSPLQVSASVTFARNPAGPLQGCSLLPRPPCSVAGPRHSDRRIPMPRTETVSPFSSFSDKPAHCVFSRLRGHWAVSQSARGRRVPTAQVTSLLPAPRVTGAAPRGATLGSECRRGARVGRGRRDQGGQPGPVTRQWGAGDRVVPVPTSHGQLCARPRASTLTAPLGYRTCHPVTALLGYRKRTLCTAPSGRSAFRSTCLFSSRTLSGDKVPGEIRRPRLRAAELAWPWVAHRPWPAGLLECIVSGETQ